MTRQNGLHYGGRQEAVLAPLDGTRTDAEIARSTGASRSYVRVVAKRNGKAHLVKPQRVTNGLAAVQADLAAALDRIAELEAAPFPDRTGFYGLIGDAVREAEKAMRKFPQPNYVISKVAEEAGEVVKAAIHCAEGRETPENVRGEMKQLIAMLYRLWVEGDGVHGLPPARAVLTPAPTGQEGA